MSKSDASSERESVLACTDCLDPADAFALIGNETRLAILEALWAADELRATLDEEFAVLETTVESVD